MLRLYKAFIYSLHGLLAAFKGEAAFRQEVILTTLLVPVAFFIEVTVVERILLISSLLLVLIIELINSAIEATIDRISMKKHGLSKIAKDTGSAAVLLAVINAIIVWVFINLG